MLGALGFDKMKMRWRFRRWGNSWRKFWRRGEQSVAHVRYQHKTCPECTAVNDRGARACAACGARLPSRTWQVLERIGVSTPKLISMSGLLGVMCAIGYVRLMVANEGGGALSFPVPVLYEYGGHLPDAVAAGDWWRLATAVFLHAGIWHIGFNLFALAIVGPHIERLYGSLVMVFLFMVTGVLANVGSGQMGLYGVGIGASGAIMGLIGATAAAGHREGTSIGRQLRNDMLKWTAYVMIFGWAIGADNWAHAFGFAAGGLFGLFVRPEWTKLTAIRPVVVLVGLLSLAGAAASTYAIVSPPASRYEQALAREIEARIGPGVGEWVRACDSPDSQDSPACIDLETQRRQCQHPIEEFAPNPRDPLVRAHYRVLCRLIGEPRADR